MNIIPTGQGLAATIEGFDLATPIGDADVDTVTRALGQYGVIRFPRQQLTGGALRDFSARFATSRCTCRTSIRSRASPR